MVHVINTWYPHLSRFLVTVLEVGIQANVVIEQLSLSTYQPYSASVNGTIIKLNLKYICLVSTITK